MIEAKDVKSGRRVIYDLEDKQGDRAKNPLWGGKYGHVVGTIVSFGGDGDFPIKVKWDNGTENCYIPKNLSLYREKGVHMIDKAKEMAASVHESIKPYEKYIGLLALAAALDYFLLDGKFTGKFKDLAEKLVKKTTDTMEGALDKILSFLDDDDLSAKTDEPATEETGAEDTTEPATEDTAKEEGGEA
jgi:hypothetical protein